MLLSALMMAATLTAPCDLSRVLVSSSQWMEVVAKRAKFVGRQGYLVAGNRVIATAAVDGQVCAAFVAEDKSAGTVGWLKVEALKTLGPLVSYASNPATQRASYGLALGRGQAGAAIFHDEHGGWITLASLADRVEPCALDILAPEALDTDGVLFLVRELTPCAVPVAGVMHGAGRCSPGADNLSKSDCRDGSTPLYRPFLAKLIATGATKFVGFGCTPAPDYDPNSAPDPAQVSRPTIRFGSGPDGLGARVLAPASCDQVWTDVRKAETPIVAGSSPYEIAFGFGQISYHGKVIVEAQYCPTKCDDSDDAIYVTNDVRSLVGPFLTLEATEISSGGGGKDLYHSHARTIDLRTGEMAAPLNQIAEPKSLARELARIRAQSVSRTAGKLQFECNACEIPDRELVPSDFNAVAFKGYNPETQQLSLAISPATEFVPSDLALWLNVEVVAQRDAIPYLIAAAKGQGFFEPSHDKRQEIGTFWREK